MRKSLTIVLLAMLLGQTTLIAQDKSEPSGTKTIITGISHSDRNREQGSRLIWMQHPLRFRLSGALKD